jgi:sigma-B regulation protein RsbU (phosphoserine phosphatase)
VGRTILADLRRGDLKRSFTRDLRELYEFYLDEEEREHLKKMRRGRRFVLRVWWLLKNLILNLSPIRRLLLVISLWLGLLQSRYSFNVGQADVSVDLRVPGFILLLIILMLELKDKLLARSELEVGRKVQRALLPETNPTLPGWDLLLYTRPANEVGGDLVDYHALGDGKLAIVLGDVSGKGLGAALLMAKLQATLWAIAGGFSSLAELGARMNAIMCRDGLPGKFATLVYLEVPQDAGAVRVLNAGHMPPIVIGGGETQELKPAAPPLGIVPDATYAEQRLEVGPGQMVVVYSDGLTEAVNESGEFYGDGRLRELLPRIRSLSAEAACELILTEVRSFIGEAPYSDDLSLVLLRRKQ